MDLLRSQLNFTYQLITSDSRSIGFRHDNGSWSGLIGLLQRNVCLVVIILVARVIKISSENKNRRWTLLLPGSRYCPLILTQWICQYH